MKLFYFGLLALFLSQVLYADTAPIINVFKMRTASSAGVLIGSAGRVGAIEPGPSGSVIMSNGTVWTASSALPGSGTVTNVVSTDTSIDISNPTTTPDISVHFPMSPTSGAVTNPSYGTPGAGMYGISYGVLGFSTLGTERLRLENNGTVEIGNGGSGSLNVNGAGTFTGNISAANYPPVGTASTAAWFNGSGTLDTLPNWSYNNWYGLNNYLTMSTYSGAASSLHNYESEITGTENLIDNNYRPNVWSYDTHFDRNLQGASLAGLTAVNRSFTFEGPGHVGDWYLRNESTNLGTGQVASASNAYLSNRAMSLGAGFTVTQNVNGDNVFYNFDPASSLLGNFTAYNIGSNVSASGSVTAMNFNHIGNAGQNSTFSNLSFNGDAPGLTLMNIQHTGGNVIGNNFNGYSLNVNGASYSYMTAANMVFPNSASSTGRTGYYINMGGGLGGTGGTGLDINMANARYNYINALNINMNNASSAQEKGVNISQSSLGSDDFFRGMTVGGCGNNCATGQWYGLEINGGNAIASQGAVGVYVDISGQPSTQPNRKATVSAFGGSMFFGDNTTTISSHPYTIDSIHGMRNKFSVAASAAITNTDIAHWTYNNTFDFRDSMSSSAFGLGKMDVFQDLFIGVASGVTVDKLSMYSQIPILGGGPFGLGSGGTATDFSYDRKYNFLSLGGALTVTDAYIYKFDSSLGALSSSVSKAHGMYLDDSGLFNYMGGKTVFGGGSYSEPTAPVDVNSDTIRIRTAKTPASASDTCNQGEIVWDSDYIYVCIATNTWKRTALSTW